MSRLLILLVLSGLPGARADGPDLSHLQVHCEDAVTRDRLRDLISAVISESLIRLDQVNRRVSDRLRKRLARRRLIVECGGRERLDADGAYADSSSGFLSPYRIALGVNADAVTGSVEQKNTILHELLHYAKVDNFVTPVHNHVWKNGLVAKDNVYSCSEVVYPGKLPADCALEADNTCRHALGAQEE